MVYRVEFTRAAEKQLAKVLKPLSAKERRNFGDTIDSLAEDPYPRGVERIENTAGLLRVRHRD